MTRSLDRKITKICGNIFILVDDTNIMLTSGFSKSSLSDDKYKNVVIDPNGDYAQDVQRVFKSAERTILFDGDDYETKDDYIIKTLIVEEDLPDRFLILNTNGSTNEDDYTLEKSYDLSKKSNIGKYLRNHLSDENVRRLPLIVDFSSNNLYINGVDVDSGSITTKSFGVSNMDHDEIVDSFSRLKMIPTTIFQLAFSFKEFDKDKHIGVFIYETKLATYENSNKIKNFVPTIFDYKNLTVDVANYDGIAIEQNSDVRWFYTKLNDSFEFCSNITQNTINISKNVPSGFKESIPTKFERIDSFIPKIIFKLTNGFNQNDKIDFIFTHGSITLIADALPNNPTFGLTDAERFVFNPLGSLEQQCESITKAFNYMVGNSNGVIARHIGDMIIIESIHESYDLNLLSVESNNRFAIVGNTKLPIKSNSLALKIKNSSQLPTIGVHYVKSKIGYHLITNSIPYEENINGVTNIGNYTTLVCSNSYFGEIDVERFWEREKLEFGITNVVENVDVATFIDESWDIHNSKYFPQQSLVIGETYTVYVGKIEHNGVTYGVGDQFMAVDTKIKFIESGSKVYLSNLLNDPEFTSFMVSDYNNIKSSVVTNEYLWVLGYGKSPDNRKIPLINSPIPSFDIKEPTKPLRTHDWYLISTDINGEFDEHKYLNQSTNYFLEYFGNKYEVVRKDTKTDETYVIFHGVKILLPNNNVGDKVSVLLNIKKLSDIYQTDENVINVKVLNNTNHKTSVIIINLGVSDWKVLDQNGNLDFSNEYLYMMNGIAHHIGNNILYGDQFSFPTLTTQFVDSSGNLDQTFRGIKIQNKCSQQTSRQPNSLRFSKNTIELSDWVRSNGEDFGIFIGIDRQSNSVVITADNLFPNSGTYSFGNKFDVYVKHDEIIFNDNKIYVVSLNGTTFDYVMPVNYIKGFINFNSFEWYQHINPVNCYENIKKIISFSGLKDLLSDNQNVSFERPINESYSGDYTLATDEDDKEKSEIFDNWTTNMNSWIEQSSRTWTYFINNTIQLSSLFNKKLNINK